MLKRSLLGYTQVLLHIYKPLVSDNTLIFVKMETGNPGGRSRPGWESNHLQLITSGQRTCVSESLMLTVDLFHHRANVWDLKQHKLCPTLPAAAPPPPRPIKSCLFKKQNKSCEVTSTGWTTVSSLSLFYPPTLRSLYIFKCPFHVEHKEKRLQVEEKEICSNFLLISFPLVGLWWEESPLHFQEGLAAVSWLQAAGTIITF